MLALRLTRLARPAVHVRRLLVTVAAAGTGFLLLSTLGYALDHPETPAASALRLAWCAAPLAATVYFALAVARTDPATKPRPGLSAFGLGPGRLMGISALTTALSTVLGSMLALLVFLHLRGDLTGLPFDRAAADFLAADQPLPLPAALTLLAVLPVIASTAVALSLRPRDPRPAPKGGSRLYGRFGARARTTPRDTFGAYGRFGARRPVRATVPGPADGTTPPPDRAGTSQARSTDLLDAPQAPARERLADPFAGARERLGDPHAQIPDDLGDTHSPSVDDLADPHGPSADDLVELHAPVPEADWARAFDAPDPRTPPNGLPWGIAVLAAGLAVEAYASRSATGPVSALPGADGAVGPTGVLVGWLLTAFGLVLAAPGLTHLTGRLLQAVRPAALRLLAGRVLMAEAPRLGRPLGVLCAVASAAYAMTDPYADSTPSYGPLATLGALLVVGCVLGTLLTVAVETRQSRADTTAALLRLGAPATMLRAAAALRAAALLAVFGPLTLVIADLAALPLSG
ncbi:hypothetical protein [Streptomyces sp. NPDC005209]|uniref:hypothetical protein n=1 Tax=Streptomyces sp. NPDC005209 TaxID=3156715 RepID=UPI0033B4F038